ncbi:MAG: hypothetical protein NTAFB09_01230 [Nitrosospira sp.]
MKKFASAGAVMISVAGFVGNVNASMITWNTETGGSSTTISCTSGVGNGCTFTRSGDVLKARAYSTNNDSGTGDFKKATINVYDGGIGVRNPDQSEENSSPNHSIDNYGRDDLVVFEFSSTTFSPESFMIGWKSGDADIRAWIGGDTLAAGYNFAGTAFSDLASLGFTMFSFNNVAVDTVKNFNTDLTGRYLIFAPQPYNSGGGDKNYDYFKISQIKGEYITVLPDTPVSEPGTLALMGIALAGLWAKGRRRTV